MLALPIVALTVTESSMHPDTAQSEASAIGATRYRRLTLKQHHRSGKGLGLRLVGKAADISPTIPNISSTTTG
jgi:hypothetical protein